MSIRPGARDKPGKKNPAPFPQVRLVGLGECGTHAIVAARLAAWRTDLEPGVTDASTGGEPARFGYLDPGEVGAESVPAAAGACREDGRVTAAAPDVENVLPVLDLRGGEQPRRQRPQHPLMPLMLLDELSPAGSVPVLGLLRIHRHEGHATSSRNPAWSGARCAVRYVRAEIATVARGCQSGHLCVQGAPVLAGGEMVYAEVAAGRRAKAVQEKPATAALAGEAEPAAVSAPWARWSSMRPSTVTTPPCRRCAPATGRRGRCGGRTPRSCGPAPPAVTPGPGARRGRCRPW